MITGYVDERIISSKSRMYSNDAILKLVLDVMSRPIILL